MNLNAEIDQAGDAVFAALKANGIMDPPDTLRGYFRAAAHAGASAALRSSEPQPAQFWPSA